MGFAPKSATVLDVISRGSRRAFGGRTLHRERLHRDDLFLLLSPIMWFGHRCSQRLVLGESSAGADRHAKIIRGDGRCRRQIWPHICGLERILILAFTVPAAIPFALVIAAGTALATDCRDHLVAGRRPRADDAGIGPLPEENAPRPLRKLALQAIEARRPAMNARRVRPAAASSGRLHLLWGRHNRGALDRLYAQCKAGRSVFDVG